MPITGYGFNHFKPSENNLSDGLCRGGLNIRPYPHHADLIQTLPKSKQKGGYAIRPYKQSRTTTISPIQPKPNTVKNTCNKRRSDTCIRQNG
ncbi:hypothetical protein [Neisseria montereyensis]|uniref:Uncharacterized protein n=1 Tax=Neisseria montereyensis TaxID=2973938 RepID=A0ABT2FCH0_9NEIS|nr:hypothetical protein [Neisseria montereyensis]MCS4533852.1 hypothetical protein [Neisseria montereyensis]